MTTDDSNDQDQFSQEEVPTNAGRTAKVIELTKLINEARKSEEELVQEAEEDRQMCANEMQFACNEMLKNLHEYVAIFEACMEKAPTRTKEQLAKLAVAFSEAGNIFGQFAQGASAEIVECCFTAEELKDYDERRYAMRHAFEENFLARFQAGLDLMKLPGDHESGVHSSAPPSSEKASHG